ncbi:hypothetical protein CA267_016175 [Alteromonas pelagimontana]|uniref:Hsp20 family protein n=1 Tax=Alteromonas pelagimontana TaxID=1858656 RepID=A0A6M4MGZ2_9ALTE|nr:hypothetical protein [Alteromonas pelagimontana]QJR82178.1 hypothetical protein CA267_016175 [Alteromonas pelagimontana]
MTSATFLNQPPSTVARPGKPVPDGKRLLKNLLFDEPVNIGSPAPIYPTFNVAMIKSDHCRITIGAPGFSQRDISMNRERTLLIITGKRTVDTSYRMSSLCAASITGNPAAFFECIFDIGEHVQISRTAMENGLLEIDLINRLTASA